MANIKADEITKILREQIENYEQTVAVDEVGSVISRRRRHRAHSRPGKSAWPARCSSSRTTFSASR